MKKEMQKHLVVYISNSPKYSHTFIERQTLSISTKTEFKLIILGSPQSSSSKSDDFKNLLSDKNKTHYIDSLRKLNLNELLTLFYKYIIFLLKHPRIAISLVNPYLFDKHALNLKAFRLYLLLKKYEGSQTVIHCHFLDYGILASKIFNLTKLKSKKLFSFVRGADITKKTYNQRANHIQGLIQADFILTPVSKSLKEILAVKHAYPESKLVVVPSGIPAEDFHFKAKTFQKESLKMLYIGRLTEKKGISISIQAIKDFCDKNPHLNISYNIVGDGPEMEQLKESISKLGLTKIINLLGYLGQEEVKSLLSLSDLLLVPSVTAKDGDKEGIPNVIKEAMLCGTIVLASDHSGIPEIINHRDTGYLFAEGSPSALCQTLQLAVDDNGLWDCIRLKAREKIIKEYDISVTTKILLNLYS